MTIEQKKLSDTEFLLFFSRPFPFRGTFYLTPETAAAAANKISPDNTPPFLAELATSDLAAELLLTEGFMYLRSISPDTAEDFVTLALAEIDDYAPPADKILTAPEKILKLK